MHLRFFAKLALFLLLLLAAQAGISRLAPPPPKPGTLKSLGLALRKDARVVHFGSSVIAAADPGDLDRSSVTQMLQKELPSVFVTPVNRGGFHLEIYRLYCQYITRARSKVEVALVEINPASLNRLHDPYYFFRIDREAIYHEVSPMYRVFRSFLGTFQWSGVTPGSRPAYMSSPVRFAGIKSGTVRDHHLENRANLEVTPERLKNQVGFRYLYDLGESGDRLAEIPRICRALLPAGIKPLFYLTPVDHETCERHWPGFRGKLRADIETIRATVVSAGGSFHDFSEMFDASLFTYRAYPNEHLKEAGRRALAARLARLLREQLAAPAEAGAGAGLIDPEPGL